MIDYERKLDYLNKNRIIYRRDPISDKPTEVYDWGLYFENGTNECYTLFSSKSKITTYKSLKWHLYVLWYLNPKLTPEDFSKLASYICDIKNGFITFHILNKLLDNIVYEVMMMDLDEPPNNMNRKVIFRDYCGLTSKEKLQIVGMLIGRNKISETEIYDAMTYLHDEKIKITAMKIANYLGCSERTVYRNMSVSLKKEKELLNKQL